MLLIRRVEERFLELFSKGLIKGTVHTCLGQEACAVGVMNAINKEIDLVFSTHRSHGHFIAYGGPLEGLIAEVIGRKEGICGGRGGSQHLHWKNFFSTGIQGGFVPVAVGAALAEKKKGSSAIVVVFLGDGTMGEGVVYEGLNLASLWKLPILFVMEHNKYAQTTYFRHAHSGDLTQRALPFGIPTQVIDGNDVELVFEKTSKIAKKVREEKFPYFLILDTYRLGPHSKGDDPRPPDEIQEAKKRDPLLLQRKKLDEKKLKEIEEEVKKMVERCFQKFLPED